MVLNMPSAIRTQELLPVKKGDGWQHSFLTAVARLTKLGCSRVDSLQHKPLRFSNDFELRLDLVAQIIEHRRFGEIISKLPFSRTSREEMAVWTP